jgi:hypothetical protein
LTRNNRFSHSAAQERENRFGAFVQGKTAFYDLELRNPMNVNSAVVSRIALTMASVAAWLAFFPIDASGATLVDPRPEHSSTLFGYSVVTIADLDGDGVADIVVGTPFQDGDFPGAPGFGTPQNVGKVFLISGRTLALIRTLDDPEFQMQQLQKFGGEFGTSVAVVNDINGDGVPDIVVGVPHHIVSPGTPDKVINAGRAFIFSGKDGALLLTLDDPTPQEGARLGQAVAGLGDVNGDGVPDVLVGAPGKDTPGVDDSQVGIAYVFSGKDGSVIRSLSYPSPTAADAGANFGAAVANAGRIGNVTSNVLIGAPRRGRAFVFNAATGKLLLTLLSPVNEALPSFGAAVAAGKDLNGDGVPDFTVGAPHRNGLRGEVFIFNGTDGTLQRTLLSPDSQTFARFGASVALTNDITGDGKPDVMVGAPDQNVNGLRNAGAAFIFKGSDGTLFKTLTSGAVQAFAGFGSSLAAADFSTDGKAEPVVGAPFQNKDITAPDGDIETHLQIGQIELP